MMIFSFFWGKNSRCGLKKTLETRGLLRSSRKKGLVKNEWCDLFLSLSLSLERARERGGTLVKTLASKRRKALLWSSVLRRASSEAFAVERGCKNNASKGQNEMREFLQNPNKQHREQKKERKQTQEQKRVLLRGKKCEYKEYCRR